MKINNYILTIVIVLGIVLGTYLSPNNITLNNYIIGCGTLGLMFYILYVIVEIILDR